MSSKNNAKSSKENTSREKATSKYFKPAILILSIIGFLLSVYLTYLHYSEGQAAFCSQGSDCDAVRQSSYSSLLGIPVALFGAVGYALIFWFTYVSLSKSMRWVLLYIISLAGFVFSLYLTYLELFVINAICFYCVVSAVIMTAIFILIALRKEEFYPKLSSLHTAVLTICVFGIVVIGSSAFQSDTFDFEDDGAIAANSLQLGLAKHLRQNGARMYGSYKCPHCNTQKALFGGASKYVDYVECDPAGPDTRSQICFSRGIMSYPTWEINGKYYEGAKSLTELSQLSGYKNSQ
ncbi:MAG: vitamin K epoxide reductase family protein [Thermodesulfobacteriota bacterium]